MLLNPQDRVLEDKREHADRVPTIIGRHQVTTTDSQLKRGSDGKWQSRVHSGLISRRGILRRR